MTAQENFIDRLTTLNRSLALDTLQSKQPSFTEHNEIAEILRNGLAVVGFTALEDFIKSRTSEVIDLIGSTTVPFNRLPYKIQAATTFESLKAITFQLSVLDDNSQKLAYVIDKATKIASTQNTPYTLNEHAYGYAQSNINHDVIATILRNFHIEDPWTQMTRLASRLNLTGLPLEETFKSAFRRRHRAAHVAHASTPLGDLAQYIKEAFAVAISFDSLLSLAFYKIKIADLNYLNLKSPQKIKETDIKFRVIRFDNNLWKEYPDETAPRAYRTNTDFELLHNQSIIRASSNLQTLVSFDGNGLIKRWKCLS
jgi:hypothetical protein